MMFGTCETTPNPVRMPTYVVVAATRPATNGIKKLSFRKVFAARTTVAVFCCRTVLPTLDLATLCKRLIAKSSPLSITNVEVFVTALPTIVAIWRLRRSLFCDISFSWLQLVRLSSLYLLRLH
jgi:hypothetical protein